MNIYVKNKMRICQKNRKNTGYYDTNLPGISPPTSVSAATPDGAGPDGRPGTLNDERAGVTSALKVGTIGWAVS